MEFARETFANTIADIRVILPAHYDEVKLNPDVIRLNIDESIYHSIEADGNLVLITARQDDRLIGYHISFLRPDNHSCHSLIAVVDSYYLMPEHRHGWNGVRLIRHAEKILKLLGVVKVYSGATIHMKTEKLFDYLGYDREEIIFSKTL